MGAISHEIVHLLKVKLPLENDQRWLLLLYWFSKFSGGEPPYPPSRLGNIRLIFQSNTPQEKTLVQSEVGKLGSKQEECFFIDL